jgi:ABC-type nitrate/sulfonate/bicarbonate transport system permease component
MKALLGSCRFEGVIVPVAAIAVAEFAARATHLESDVLAPPSAVLAAGAEGLIHGTMLIATGQTLATAVVGLAIGILLDVALGILLGLAAMVDRMMEFTIESLRPIPAVAIIPLGLLIFGFGYRMELSIVGFATFWTMLILTRAAVRDVEPRLFEVARALGFGQFPSLTKIYLPAALPRIFVAVRLSASIALIVAVTVEIASNNIGLGYRMMEAQSSLHPDLGLAYLTWIGLLGWSINNVLLWLQRRLFGRMGSVRLET